MTPIFRVRKTQFFFCRPRTFPAPPRIIFDVFQKISRRVIFSCEKLPKHFQQLQKIFEKISVFFSPEKFQKLPEQFWHSPKLPGAYRNHFGLVVHSETTFRFSLSKLFRRLRNLSGDFISDSLSSIQQIDDP